MVAARKAFNRPVKQLIQKYYSKVATFYLLVYQTHSYACIHVIVYIQVISSRSSCNQTETQLSCNQDTTCNMPQIERELILQHAIKSQEALRIGDGERVDTSLRRFGPSSRQSLDQELLVRLFI